MSNVAPDPEQQTRAEADADTRRPISEQRPRPRLQLSPRRAAIALGVFEAGVILVRSAPTGQVETVVVLAALVILAGAWVAWRRPTLMGGALVLLGVILTPTLAWAIDFGRGWTTENPGAWGFSEYFTVVLVGGIPLVAGSLLLVSAGMERRCGVRQRSENIRRARSAHRGRRAP